MELTLFIDDDIVKETRRRATVMGISLDQLVSDYLEQFVGLTKFRKSADEFERLSLASAQKAVAWKFNRDELHERKES